MMLKSSLNWLLEKLGNEFTQLIDVTSIQLEPIFVIIAMMGVFLILFGQKRWGTRLTSVSILIYTLTRVMS